MRSYHNSHLSFIDMLFNALIVFAALFILTVMIINDPTHKTKTVDERAKIMIVMTWDDQSADDMDLWLLTPEPDKIGYGHRDSKLANLARDDLGKVNDTFNDKYGKIHYIHLNKEVITIRDKMEGHYVVDVMFFQRQRDPENDGKMSVGPQEVTVQLIQIDPSYEELATKTVVLNNEREDRTALSFDIVGQNITNVDTVTQTPFILSNMPQSEEQ